MSDPVRSAFVSTHTVTAEQWEDAARVTRPGDDVLATLTSQPAWWSAGGSAPAVTSYHLKLVPSLAKAGALASLARRLRWGKYLIRGELGRGGMGVVVRGWDLDAGADVALKRMRGQSRDGRERFRREGEILSRLDHPSIARFAGVDRLDGADVLVMEYVPGESASRLVRRLTREGQRVPWKTAVGWAVEVLDALAHAHGRQVIHRDIKPGNLMITGIGGAGVKLLDMGLAKCGELADADLTRAGQILGTCEYMPPEQWAGGKTVTPAADLYALGGTLFFLLTGRSPYSGSSMHQQMHGHLSAEVPAVRAERADVPEPLDAVVRRMLAKNPLHRGTARELRWQLEGVLAARDAAAVLDPVPADVGWGPYPRGDSTVSRGSALAGRSSTVLGGGASTAVRSRVWPLVREMGGEVKRLVGLGRRHRTSVYDDPPLVRLLTLGLAVVHTLRGRP